MKISLFRNWPWHCGHTFGKLPIYSDAKPLCTLYALWPIRLTVWHGK